MNPTAPQTQTPTPGIDPRLAKNTVEPLGVLRRNLKMHVYLGIAALLTVATAVSSLHHKTAANKVDPNIPPAPMVQDASAATIEEMKKEIAKQQDAVRLASVPDSSLVAAQATLPGQTQSQFVPNGMLSGASAAPPSAQPQPLTPQQQQALAFDTQDKELAYKARFVSNLAYSQSQDIRGPASQMNTGSATLRPSAAENGAMAPYASVQPSASPSSMIEPHISEQDPPSTEKRPEEVNLNSATGQPYVVYEGTTLETVLMNRLDGDAAGPVKVMVTIPIYSHDHQHILVPEGTVVLGEARKIGATGFGQQRRMAIVFHRMIMPDGYSVDLDQFQGLNQIGETGLKDKVTNHYLAIFGTSIALGIIGGAAEISNTGGALTGNGVDAYKYGVAASLSENATTVLDRFINIPPTITIREGYRVKVYLSQDMLLPAVENHTISQTY
jgi:type IV secretion system protein TrbI